MANTLRFKRGLASGIPTALAGEPLFTTDTFDLYIGNGTTNTRFQKYIASGTTGQLLRGDGSLLTMPIVLTSPSNGQVLKYNGTSWVNDSDSGITGSGTTNYISKFTGSSTLGNSSLIDNISSIAFSFSTNPVYSISDGTRTSYIGTATTAGAYNNNTSIGDLILRGFNGVDIEGGQGAGGGIRVTNVGRVLIGSTSDNGLRFQVTGDGYFSGGLGVGGITYAYEGISLRRNLTGLTVAFGVVSSGTIQSDVTSGAYYFTTGAKTQAAAFTLGNLYHYDATQGTFGAGSTVTNQYGFFAGSSIIGATNNFGFYGNIASGTGRWNLYMNGSAANFMNGSLGIGVISPTTKLEVSVTGNNGIRITNSGNTGSDFAVLDFVQGGTQKGVIYTNNDIMFVNSSQLRLSSTGANPMLFSTNGSERMRLDASGNLAVGTTNTDIFSRGDARNVVISATGASDNMSLQLNAGASGGRGAQIYMGTGGVRYFTISTNVNETQLGTVTSTPIIFYTNNAEKMRLFSDGNFGIGTGSTNAGFKLDVNGTMRVSGASTFGGNLNLPNAGEYYLQNAASTTFIGLNFDTPYIRFGVGGTVRAFMNATGLGLGTASPAYRLDVQGTLGVTGAATFASSVTSSNAGNVNYFLSDGTDRSSIQQSGAGMYLNVRDNNATGGSLIIRNSNALTELARLNSTGLGLGTASPDARLRVAGAINSTQAIFGNVDGRGLAISTSLVGGTNEAGVILNARSSVTSGTFIFQTDGTQRVLIDSSGLTVTGGNGYEVVNSASNNVTALRPTGGGTSIMSTNSNGLHIAVGTEAAGDLILASNNTERIRLSSNGFFSQINATNPSASITDSYIQYSADVTAGNAAPHFRTENGAVIKIYQETTSVGNSIFSQGGGNSVLDDSTFDGYTLRQIVKALRNQGILA